MVKKETRYYLRAKLPDAGYVYYLDNDSALLKKYHDLRITAKKEERKLFKTYESADKHLLEFKNLFIYPTDEPIEPEIMQCKIVIPEETKEVNND